jgi:hypothetical protein
MAKASSVFSAASLTAAACLALMLSGCRIDEHKNGDTSDVKIATPFGGMTVKTNDAVVEGGTGLTPYPGAVVLKKDKDNGAADINMSFGSFHLGVKAISYTTPDPPDKVIAFYRKDMAHFGAVILCRNEKAVGTPDHTQDGLSCDKDKGGKINIDDDSAQSELKAGSKQHQHIVAVDPQGTGTKIGLIALDLPSSHLGKNDDSQE